MMMITSPPHAEDEERVLSHSLIKFLILLRIVGDVAKSRSVDDFFILSFGLILHTKWSLSLSLC